MKDNFDRDIHYLRLSITDLCNFRCNYCMPPEGVDKFSHEKVLTLEEMAEVVRLLAVRLGFHKVRITGGEPLIRRGVLSFIQSIGSIPEIRDLSMTTNALLLAEMAKELKAAGVGRLNISLDTLQRDRFKQITGVDGLDNVLKGIEAVSGNGFQPIKLNVVAMGETLDEACNIVRFGLERKIEVRFIELMPVIGRTEPTYVSNDRVKTELEKLYKLEPIIATTPTADIQEKYSAARRFSVKPVSGSGEEGTCGFISPISHPFCQACNRIRMSGSGQIKPCLSRNQIFDLMPLIRPTFEADKLVAYVNDVVSRFKKRSAGNYQIESMSTFGG